MASQLDRTVLKNGRGYIENLERWATVTHFLAVSLIPFGSQGFDGFVQNYNMHSLGKTVNELHAMLKLHEQTLPKNNAPALHAIQSGKVQIGKKHNKPQPSKAARGQNQGNGKNKHAYAPKPKIPPPRKREDPAKDSICYECGETGHWKRNCPTRRPTDRMCLYIDAEEHELGDLGEPANYKAAAYYDYEDLENGCQMPSSMDFNEESAMQSIFATSSVEAKYIAAFDALWNHDDSSHIENLRWLDGEPKWFKRGSRILITTRDEQVLIAHRVDIIRDTCLLSNQEATSLFSRHAFGRENPLQGYKELSGKVVRYAAGILLTIKVLGSFLFGKDKLEWVDAIDRLQKILLKDTLEKLELSYMSLEDEYKEIFQEIVCILKGQTKEDAIKILEC
ncbi:Toll/interleukin-1 receptor domain-containing protein, partial [Tanacetum coccineum]